MSTRRNTSARQLHTHHMHAVQTRARAREQSNLPITPPVNTAVPPPTSEVPVPPKSVDLRIPLPKPPVAEDGTELYLSYSATPGERADYGGKFTFIPLDVRLKRKHDSPYPVQVLYVPRNTFTGGSSIYIAYYVEETGDTFGMSNDWHILGAYATEEEARRVGNKYKSNYRKGYFNHLIGVYIYATKVIEPGNYTIEL